MMARCGDSKAAITSFLLVLLVLKTVVAVKYDTGAKPVPGKLNVHFVAHSHDDLGWLLTVDQYYTSEVRSILNTVTQELEANPDRKYIQVETGFFARWWNEQNDDTKAKVKKLVADGQIEFTNGGWCMHDEATTHYLDMIDQTTYGHRFLKREFGVIPKHGWQIDPFGHSAVAGYLLGAEAGFESMFTARIDYQERRKRRNDKTLEMIWRASDTLGSTADIFYGVFPVHYNPPDTFELEPSNSHYTPVQDDKSSASYNVDSRVDALVAAAQTQATLTRTNHIMWTMGDDFTYQNAATWFENMDKLIHYANLDGRVNVLYSNPSLYLESKLAANESWPVKTGDFFPYADSAVSYWTGYFTSRAALKGYVRKMSGYLQAANQLEFLRGTAKGSTTDLLQDAMATVQHHDGVSGTEKQAVASDYTLRLFQGAADAEAVVNQALGCLTSGSGDQCTDSAGTTFEQCPYLNLTYCAATEAALAGKALVVVAYNPLAWARSEYVRVLVSHTEVSVSDSDGKQIEAQLIPVTDDERKIRSFYVQVELGVKPSDGRLYWLVFEAAVPALGFASFVVSPSKQGVAHLSTSEELKPNQANDVKTIGGDHVNLLFSAETGKISEMVHVESKTKSDVVHDNLYYSGDNGEDGQASGAYIFRPQDDTARPVAGSSKVLKTTIVRGPLVEEVHQVVSPWVTQVYRVYKGQQHAEVEFTIGPIPVDDGVGKEVISRVKTAIPSAKTVYTDSNGRDFIKRVRDHRDDWNLEVTQPVAGNYYPLNLGLYITDGVTDFSLLVDRAVGGASLSDGEVEVMLHRNLLSDDGRGVGEALNEQVCLGTQCEGLTVRGKYYISLAPKESAALWRRTQGQILLSPLQLAFTNQLGKVKTFSAVNPKSALPANVALLTLQDLGDGTVLLRLGHLYQANEHSEMSKTATVDLKNFFNGRTISEATELSLTANQAKADMTKKYWRVQDNIQTSAKVVRGSAFDPKTLIVELGPMEIRTFSLKF